MEQKALLIILDGWGIGQPGPGNAITQAKLPIYRDLLDRYPNGQLAASGEAVGLPEGQIGTSEVNHLTIGAGRVLHQSLVRINNAIKDKSFFTNQALVDVFAHTKKYHSKLHIVGLYSFGGVHSHANHAKALIEAAIKHKVPVVLHLFTDGRDVMPWSAVKDVGELEQWIAHRGYDVHIATISGRYYAMDRDENWGRTNAAFEALHNGIGQHTSSPQHFLTTHQHDKSDEYVVPTIVQSNYHGIQDGDGIVCFNFRADRMRQLTQLVTKSDKKNLFIATMMKYRDDLPTHTLFPTLTVKNHLVEILEHQAITHHHISETEKYAHVTYFFNGRHEELSPHEKRVHLKSASDIATHDLRPQMQAGLITDAVVALCQKERKGFIVVNFANADIVGHTANIPAAIVACETLDAALGKIIPVAYKNNWTVFITADHGNAEMLIDPETGGPHTAHTLNPVPFIALTRDKIKLKRNEGMLSDVAPTILKTLGIGVPREMTGVSLI